MQSWKAVLRLRNRGSFHGAPGLSQGPGFGLASALAVGSIWRVNQGLGSSLGTSIISKLQNDISILFTLVTLQERKTAVRSVTVSDTITHAQTAESWEREAIIKYRSAEDENPQESEFLASQFSLNSYFPCTLDLSSDTLNISIFIIYIRFRCPHRACIVRALSVAVLWGECDLARVNQLAYLCSFLLTGPSDAHPEALKTLPAGKGYFLCLERVRRRGQPSDPVL